MTHNATAQEQLEKTVVSIITPSLNHGRFLQETIDSVFNQTYKNIEHVIADGGSTDDTVEILKRHPRIKWVSEKEPPGNGILDAIWKAFYMSSGEYIVFLCVSDGFVDMDWLKKAVEVLDSDKEISRVWGIVQSMSEDGQLGKLWNAEFCEFWPFQKMDFLPFWLATAEGVECNAVFRRHIFEAYYPKNTPAEAYRVIPGLGFNYQLNTRGYLPYFLPMIANFGRVHDSQGGQKYHDQISIASDKYFGDTSRYKERLLAGKIRHFFRNSNGEIIGEVKPDDLVVYKKLIRQLRLKNSLKRKFQRVLNRI